MSKKRKIKWHQIVTDGKLYLNGKEIKFKEVWVNTNKIEFVAIVNGVEKTIDLLAELKGKK